MQIILFHHVRPDSMEQVIEAKFLHFERIHSDERSSDQRRLMTRLPGLDISLCLTTPLLLGINERPAINRCREEVIDRLSEIMMTRFSTFRATRDWTAW